MRRQPPPPGPYLHMLERVEALPDTFPRFPDRNAPCITVRPIWKDVDRPQGTGNALHAEDADLVAPLVALIERGDAYSAVDVRTDIDGRTYVNADARFTAGDLRRDLKALGA